MSVNKDAATGWKNLIYNRFPVVIIFLFLENCHFILSADGILVLKHGGDALLISN
jgi:hypothetical protein